MNEKEKQQCSKCAKGTEKKLKKKLVFQLNHMCVSRTLCVSINKLKVKTTKKLEWNKILLYIRVVDFGLNVMLLFFAIIYWIVDVCCFESLHAQRKKNVRIYKAARHTHRSMTIHSQAYSNFDWLISYTHTHTYFFFRFCFWFRLFVCLLNAFMHEFVWIYFTRKWFSMIFRLLLLSLLSYSLSFC